MNSSIGGTTTYAVPAPRRAPKATAILMDLDGTTIRSEPYWIELLERTMRSLLDDPGFRFDQGERSSVSGRTVAEHLAYATAQYSPAISLDQALRRYVELMRSSLEAGEHLNAKPVPGLVSLLTSAKERGVKIALVSSGWEEKVSAQLEALFERIGLGDPRRFYDAIITGGSPAMTGAYGTVGELTSKPHPWLYSEAARIGLGIPEERRGEVIGLEDSAAGVCALTIAGYRPIGVAGGNLVEAGAEELCERCVSDLSEILPLL